MWRIVPSRHGETETFYEIYDTFDKFKSDYNSIGYPTTTLTETNLQTVYNLLYAEYGLDEIANMTQEQFKFRLFGIIFKYGPTWQKKLEIQANLRGISETDLLVGSKAIYNRALNPETQPKTGDLDEIDYINEQNTTNYKKSKMDAYMQLWNLLATDVTSDFINKFRTLFKTFINPYGYGYVQEEE